MGDVLIVIPAFNEEQNIDMVLDDIIRTNTDTDVLVVNDGSTDRTQEIVCQRNFEIVSHSYNRGYGAALQTGFRYAVSKGYKYVIQFDADGQHDARDINSIL